MMAKVKIRPTSDRKTGMGTPTQRMVKESFRVEAGKN
jgi:hypothetical protein